MCLRKLILTYKLRWSFDLFRKGYKRGITVEELWQARDHDHSGRLGDALERAWQRELDAADRSGSKPSLSKAIVRTFWVEYMLCGLLVGLLFIVLWPLVPYTLALFINYFSGELTPETYRNAHIYNFLMNACSIMTAMMLNHLQLSQGAVGMRVRIACCSLLYRKILKLGRNGMSKTEPGQVINLMSNDVMRFDVVTLFLHYLWVMPIVVPVVSFLVWQHLGWATFAALAVIFFQTVLVQAYLSNRQGVLRGKIAKRTDERVKVMSELVNGVQVIKMYAWEKPFEKLVDMLRKLEVNFIMRTSMIKGFSTALSVFTERFILFSAIVTFVLLGGQIRAEIAFSLVQYFNLLQLAANIFFPLALSSLAEVMVSIKRLEDFLMLEELDSPKAIEAKLNIQEAKVVIGNGVEKERQGKDEKRVKHTGLVLAGVSASWAPDRIVDTLRDVSLTAAPGEFVGVAGLVGAGKSSLLQVILGELLPSRGSVSLGGARIAYASQEPWLFVATVRQNILFGLPYDRIRYKKVVTACALLRDFEQLPSGDSTLVGERGISLSGGQRARIGLARACYRQGEVEIEGTFEDVSRSSLFDELVEEEEPALDIPVRQLMRQRTMSIQSQTSAVSSIQEGINLEDFEEPQETAELMAKGRVSGSVYTQYFRAGGSWCLLLFTVISILLAQVVTSLSDLWLTYWMNNVEANITEMENAINKTLAQHTANFTSGMNDTASANLTNDIYNSVPTTLPPAMTTDESAFYIYIWAIGILGCILLTTGRSMLFPWVCMRSSIKLHNLMFGNILAATMRFFDTNPSGRILNRFSKDMGIVDEILPRLYLDSIQVMMVMAGILVMVAIVNPFMLLTTLVCGILMWLWTLIYLSTAQAIKRVEGVTRSPVFSHVSASMAGLSTVRACGAQAMLRAQFDDKQDVHTAAWYLTLAANTAFSIWLSLISAMYVVIVAYTFLFLNDGTTKAGNVGLAISQGLILVNMVQYGVKQITEVISQMTSVERVTQFTSLPQEVTDGPSQPKEWPQRARLVFKDLYLRYDKDAEPVLKNLNIVIESGWKVGVVGRTGAGKSSLISALFRLAPIDGHVYIDDVDTGEIALKELRAKIAIIPQEPVLFSASLRYNMDPFDKYTDEDIWKALEQVELKQSVTSLTAEVASGGTNFSAGQRQLLCLARAALARNRLLVLDEATANVDPNTDALIQKSIRKYFADCTVLTVAHRLHTVADSDRVIVMEAGQMVESGGAHELLQNPQSLRELARAALLAPAALMDIKSSIGTSANLFPQLHHDILAAVDAKDLTKARELQNKLCIAIEAHVLEGDWVPIMKAGMEIVTGIKVGPPSLPQRPISAEARKRIEGKLRDLKLIK